jgi:hypothetical protein
VRYVKDPQVLDIAIGNAMLWSKNTHFSSVISKTLLVFEGSYKM